MTDGYILFPARVPWCNPDGTLTTASIRALGQIAKLFGGSEGKLPPDFVFIPADGTPFGISYIDSDGTITSTDAPENGQLIVGSSGAAPVLSTLAGAASEISISNGPGTISIGISDVYAGQESISTVGTILIGTWNGEVVAPEFGGTGISAYTIGDILYASGSAQLASLPSVAAGNALISGGVGSPPSWGKINLASHVTGNLPVSRLNSGSGASAASFWRGDGTWASIPSLGHGTYTPTLTNITNLDSSSAHACQYLRVGNTVTVSGLIEINATTTGNTQLRMTLPIPSNFTQVSQCAGVAAAPSASTDAAGISADITNDQALFGYQASMTSNILFLFTFTYLIQ